ncbi:MAG: P-loop NTPase [Nitrospirae bacterium]|nr:P-loop NTPase [Nitrospirota bacterium]
MDLPGKKIWAVGGGKGGIGKSIVTANLGIALARKGKRVIFIDADLGGANLHTYLGITFPKFTLTDFIQRRKETLEEVLIPTEVAGLQLITGAADILGMANPKFPQKHRLIQAILRLSADYILIDLGAGTHYNILDFFNTSGEGIVVVCPEPPAIQNAYGFIKNAIYRKISREFYDNPTVLGWLENTASPDDPEGCRDLREFKERVGTLDPEYREKVAGILGGFRPRLIVNMAQGPKDAAVAEALQTTAQKYLDVQLEFVGFIPMDEAVKRSARFLKPFYLADPQSAAARKVDEMVESLLRKPSRPGTQAWEIGSEANQTGPAPADGRGFPGHPIQGLNEDVLFNGRVFHVQTEDLGSDNPVIQIQVFSDGRVLFKKTLPYLGEIPPEDRSALADFLQKHHRTLVAGIRMGKLRFS